MPGESTGDWAIIGVVPDPHHVPGTWTIPPTMQLAQRSSESRSKIPTAVPFCSKQLDRTHRDRQGRAQQADQGVGPVARLQAGVLRRALPGTWDQVLSLAHHVVCEGSAPLSRFPRYAATHATPHGAPIASQRSSELLASIGEEGRDALCDSLARRHGEGDRLSCDTTSASSRSEALAQVRRGRDEDRVPLPQASLAMLVGHGSGMPPCYRGVAGNVADAGAARAPMRDTGPSFASRVRLAAGCGLRRRRAPTPWRASASSS